MKTNENRGIGTGEGTEMKKIVLMMGGPASGKSTIAAREYPNLPRIDCDSFKEAHPDYDPKDPGALHHWSVQEWKKAYHAAMANGVSFVLDGTGANAERLVSVAKTAHDLGYEVTLLYVRCSLRTALERNRNRPRTVPVEIVRSKHAMIGISFEIVSGYVDHVVTIVND